MSFSEQIKDEVLNNLKLKNCCKRAMRYGELYSESNDIKKSEVNDVIGNRICCKKAFLKGVFLGSGYIISPAIEYHFEVSLNTKQQAVAVIGLLSEFNIKARCIKRNKYVVYIKDAENISNVLRVLSATNALVEFENIRIEKSIKNDINRNVNCETANINKIVNSAYKQIKAIEKIENSSRYLELNDEIKQLCNLRKNNPEASLEELATSCSYKISKSGVYHRLNKIIKMAENI